MFSTENPFSYFMRWPFCFSTGVTYFSERMDPGAHVY